MQDKSANMFIGVIAAIVVLGGGIWFVASRGDDSTTKTQSTSQSINEAKPAETAPSQNIVEIAAANSDFSTLVDLVKTAGLVDTLSSAGPFTVFAPTNDAFAKLPAETVADLKANPEKLKAILTYHVVSGNVGSSDVVKLSQAQSVQGGNIAISIMDGKVLLNGSSTVTKTDIKASNGVIHVIDSVILPPSN